MIGFSNVSVYNICPYNSKLRFIGDDDTYVIMENLRQYLSSFEENHQPILLGHRMTLQWWEMMRPLGEIALMEEDERY